jgi:hypothetical protein
LGHVPVTETLDPATNEGVAVPVPPLTTGNGVPDNPTANVPVVVTGDPETDKKDGTVIPTDVTVPVPEGTTNWPGVDQANADVVLELTRAIETQTGFAGDVGGVFDQPVGGVPTFVVKLHEPPVGVDGAVTDSLKISHSKYVPPMLVLLPYKPVDSAPEVATKSPVVVEP